MKQLVLVAFALVLGVISGALISPLLAQSSSSTPMACFVGEASNAACGGKWIYFAGNTSNLDESAWVVRVNSETGAIWYKDGKKMQLLRNAE